MTTFEWLVLSIAVSFCIILILSVAYSSRTKTEVVGVITIGSRWRHHSGREYTVICLANEYSSKDEYPEVVVYQGANKRIWAKTKTDFLVKMTLIQEMPDGQ